MLLISEETIMHPCPIFQLVWADFLLNHEAPLFKDPWKENKNHADLLARGSPPPLAGAPGDGKEPRTGLRNLHFRVTSVAHLKQAPPLRDLPSLTATEP